VFGMQSDAYWLDIGTPEKYLRAHTDLLDGELGVPPAPGADEHAPGIWVQGATEIAEGAVKAPALVAAGARIAAGAHVEASTIGPGCVVERGARVYRSVMLGGARVAAGAELSDSVVGPDAVLETGVSASDLTLVGASAVISAGSVVSGGRIHVPPRSP